MTTKEKPRVTADPTAQQIIERWKTENRITSHDAMKAFSVIPHVELDALLELLNAPAVSKSEPILKTTQVPDGEGGFKLAARFYDYGYFERVMTALRASRT